MKIRIYPRTSIDNARRVRQLAHTLQGALTALAGKRVAPHLHKVIGAWLSGAYDSDRLVARAAQDSISTAFSSEERRRALWTVYRSALTDYANDAILVQTSQTLSDERSTTADDAEAKHIRVLGNALQMLSQMVKINFSTAQRADNRSIPEDFRSILGHQNLWEYSSYPDASPRRAICSLVTVCAVVIPQVLDWKIISACFVGKALHSNQLGSSRSFSEALLSLTTARPEIWTTDYTSNTAASKRLSQFLRKGSQRGPAEYWSNVEMLVKKIPVSAWSTATDDPKQPSFDDTSALLESLRTGITNNEEPRQNLEAAWLSYVELSFWAFELLVDDHAGISLLKREVLPLVNQYIASDPKQGLWDVPSSCNIKVSVSILTCILRCNLHALFKNTWVHLSGLLGDTLKMSSPESSKDFVNSQETAIGQSRRLFRLKSLILQAESIDSSEKVFALDIFRASDENLVSTAIGLLRSRSGKPYAAAAVIATINAAAQSSPPGLLHEFLRSDALEMLSSPSAEYLATLLVDTGQDLARVLTKLISTPEDVGTSKALVRLLSQVSEEDLLHTPEIEPFMLDQLSRRLENASVQQVLKSMLQNPKLASSTLQEKSYQRLMEQLSPETPAKSQHAVLSFLLNLATDRFSVSFRSLAHHGSQLLTKLLVLSDHADPETAQLATSLLAKIRSTPIGTSSSTTSSAFVISDQLSGMASLLSIFTLIDLAKDALDTSQNNKMNLSLAPTNEQWTTAFADHLKLGPPLSLSLTTPLRGVLFMVKATQFMAPAQLVDLNGFSMLFRLVLYTTRLLHDSDLATIQTAEQLNTLYLNYPLALQLVNEKLTIEAANNVWQDTSDEVAEEAAETLALGNSLIQQWIADAELLKVWIERIRSIEPQDPQAYYHGLAFTDIASRYVDEHGSSLIMSTFEPEMKELHKAQDVVKSASLISISRGYLNSSPHGRRLLNELVAAGTDLKASSGSEVQLRPLVLLDILLDGNSEILEDIPSQRLVFFLQTLIRVLNDPSSGLGHRTMALRLLEAIITSIKDLYGEHWEQLLKNVVAIWQNGTDMSDDLPLLHASLRLYGRLKSLSNSDDANEDLLEAWKNAQKTVEEGLLTCLKSFNMPSNEVNKPRKITAELLRRQLSDVTARHDTSLYSLLPSTEDPVRGAAYELLHHWIPAEQEEISLSIALEQETARLPPELVMLLGDPPQASVIGTSSLRQSYLLAWNLAFDHFSKASYKLRGFYLADIKEQGILGNLLDLICDLCQITSGRPLDASKFDVTRFELGSNETDQKEEQCIAMHLYYRCLLHLPGLTRSWFIEQKNRVKSPLESWTQKYFAPSLISAAASTVTEWVQVQPQEETDATLMVKTSLSGSEIVASIAVDPESPPISLAISLPKSYPLDSPTVSPRTRVGVSEKNWQSWLRTFQIIIFSTGSVIEGLIAFRRNVHGALRGQSECAICYSIIGTDMQTPNKRCGTCRNNFHGVCLFRWFKSSNSSSCPLCRNNFNYA